MYIARNVDSKLIAWGRDVDHKPLLVRGARQVGKSSCVREYAKTFEYYIEINFEIDFKSKSLFEQNYTIKELCSNLGLIHNTPIVGGKTLLFLDEIQFCPQAISLLRYFYEQFPELHVIAAGSLLEFALKELPSFGVGRIRSIFVYPLSFNEFLGAIGEHMLLDAKKNASITKPLATAIHEKLQTILKQFLLIGGMPEVVVEYATYKDLLRCKLKLQDLLYSFQDDFSKYAKKVPSIRINEVFKSVILQMGNKFMYSKAAVELNNRQVKDALQLLIMAGLVIPVTHTSANGIPLGAEINPKNEKMLMLDTGLFQQLHNLELSEMLINNDFKLINKGNIAELHVGLELLKSSDAYTPSALYYWQREKNGTNAEVDYIVQIKNNIIPIEVKSGSTGSMQSLHQFMKEKKTIYGIRTSLENFTKYENISVCPLYAISEIDSI